MVLDVVDYTSIIALHNIFSGYMSSLARDIMDHIMAQYGRINAAGIKMRRKAL